MDNLYKIDGTDIHGAFGFRADGGSDDFLRLPTRKDPPTYVWPDDLTEYDLSVPAFHGKEVILSGTIMATSEADFWIKYNALWDVISAPGERIIEVVQLGQSYKTFYKENPISERLTRIVGASKVAWKVTLVFQLTDFADGTEPGPNGGFVQIVNQSAEVIATVQAPGTYEVMELSGIYDDGSGTYPNSIIDNS